MPRFYTRRNEVPLGPGQKLGFKRGRGYFAAGAALPFPGFRTPEQLKAEALAAIEDALRPAREQVERQRARDREYQASQQAALMGYWQRAAQMTQGIAPAIQGAYAEGAQNTAAFGKGYSDGLQMLQQQNAGEANKLLAQNNAPEGQQIQAGPEAANVLYGLGGEIPATALQREGSAFTAAAAQLPLTALGYGGEALQDLMRQGSEVESKYADVLADLEAKRPGLIREAMAELQELQLAQRNEYLKERAFEFETGLKTADFERKTRNDQFSQQARTVSLNQAQQRIDIQLDRLGLSQKQYQLAVRKERRLTKGAKKGGFTRAQLQQLRQKADGWMDELYFGIAPKTRWDKDRGEYVNIPGTGKAGVGYYEAVGSLVRRGVPVSIAYQIADEYYQVGEDGRPDDRPVFDKPRG